MIYTASIICSLPFSMAAEPAQKTLWSGAAAFGELHNSEMLWEALERTDLANVWNGMAGVLYWICTVDAAAARTPTVLTLSQRDRYCKPCKFRVQQCLTMFSMRVIVVLIFKHPIPSCHRRRGSSEYRSSLEYTAEDCEYPTRPLKLRVGFVNGHANTHKSARSNPRKEYIYHDDRPERATYLKSQADC